MLHAEVNDVKLWQMKTVKRNFRSLIETVCSTLSVDMIMTSSGVQDKLPYIGVDMKGLVDFLLKFNGYLHSVRGE